VDAQKQAVTPAASPEVRAVLCLHGFTGTPFEVQPLADALARAGYRVGVPMLAGHGADVAALEATTWLDWLRSAENAFDELAATTRGGVAVLGFSMGGLLALQLAKSRSARVAALALLAAPLILRPAHVRGIRLLGALPRSLRRGPLRSIPKLFGSNVGDREARRRNPALRSMPLLGLQSLLELMAHTRGTLADVTAPAMVVHGRHDRTVPLAASIELADALATNERLWLDHSRHLVGIDIERTVLADAIAAFLASRARW
jgi:carboxylesterase